MMYVKAQVKNKSANPWPELTKKDDGVSNGITVLLSWDIVDKMKRS